MIARLRGEIVSKTDDEVIIDCAGVGYTALISNSTSQTLPSEGTVILHTYLAVREDAMQLFGFATNDEKTAFLLLNSVSGIGGKTALSILSGISLGELRDAILTKNLLLLQKLPGIGKKTAERVVLELRDKIGSLNVSSPSQSQTLSAVQQETVSALVVLGYNRVSAEKAVRTAMSESPSTSWATTDLLKTALKFAVK
jgi:holliday junction DNA helicase RuvA